MENAFKLLLATAFIFTTLTGIAQNIEEVTYNPNLLKDTTKKSINARVVGIIGGDTVTINYHSPGVRGRIIWGGLVPFDEVWVTGAHSATSIEVPRNFTIGGKLIPAGKYAFFTIPGKTEWTLILNRNWDQHLADDYSATEDVIRLNVVPKQSPHTERLQYFVEPAREKKFVVAMAWEKLRVEFPIQLN